MENDFTMADILLDKDKAAQEKSVNIKKILMGISVLVIIFLIVLIIMKFINRGNIDTNDSITMPNEQEILTPNTKNNEMAQNTANTPTVDQQIKIQTKPAEIQQIEPSSQTTKEPTQIEIKPDNSNAKVVEIKPIAIAPEPPKKVEQPVKIEEPKKILETTQIKKEITVPQKPKKIEKTQNTNIKKSEPVKAQQTVTKQNVESKKNEKSVFSNNSKNKQIKISDIKNAKPKVAAVATTGNTYIQVLAFSSDKKENIVTKKLKEKGYSYKFQDTVVNGKKMTKILVGPYDNANIESKIKQIRSEINPEAFVYRAK